MARAGASKRQDDDAKQPQPANHWLPLTAMLLGGIGAARHLEASSVKADGKPVSFEQIDPRTIHADPATFQFKSGGDAAGVTDRMAGVSKWDQLAAGKAIVWERRDGERFIADGHQRRGLALRAIDAGQKGVALDAYVMKERDGWTSKDVRAYAALKNMKELSGSAVDFAKVVRERPDLIDGSLPMSDGKIRQAMSLSKLSEPAFNMVVSGGIKPEHAAAVGEAVRDSSRHVGMLTEMAKAGMGSEQHARLYVSQALAAPEIHETTGSLFGEETNVRSLLAERAKVLDKAMTALKSDKRIFGLLEREAGTIEAAGNKLSHETNAAKAEGASQTAALIEKLATTRGPVSSMLDKAALAMADGQSPGQAARAFVREVGDTMQSGGVKALLGGDMEHEMAKKPAQPDPNQSSMFGEPTTKDKIAAQSRAQEAKGRVGDPANEGLFGSSAKQTDIVDVVKATEGKARAAGINPFDAEREWTTNGIKDSDGNVWKKEPGGSTWSIDRTQPVTLPGSKVAWDRASEAAKIASMSDKELAQTERTNKARATPNMAARHRIATEEIERRKNPGWSDQARTRSAEVRKDKAGSNAAPAGGKVEKVTRAGKGAGPNGLSAVKGVQINAMLHDMNLATSGTRAAKEARITAAMRGSSINRDTVDFYAKDHAAAKKTMAEVKAARAAPATAKPASWSSSMAAQPHAITTKPPRNMSSDPRLADDLPWELTRKPGTPKPTTTDPHTPAPVKAPTPEVQGPPYYREQVIRRNGIQHGTKMVKVPPKAPKPPKGKGGGKAIGLLAPVAIGAAMLAAANEAKAQGTSQTAAAAKEGAAGAGGMAVFMGGTAAATAGLVRAGMTAARAVPVVQGALMAGGALKGAWDARKGGAGAMAAGAAKGAWDMSLPGMVVNTGLAAKDAVQGRMAVTAGPSTAPASFQAASERFHAMRAAAATSDAGEKKKGWSNAARIGAYKARMAKSGANPTNMPYGGAVEPPKPLK